MRDMNDIKRDARRALYPYAQSFTHGGRTFHRRGFIALVRLFSSGSDESYADSYGCGRTRK